MFELRLAAKRHGVALETETFRFDSCSVDELRAALGDKVLSYLEPVLGPVVLPYLYRSDDGVDRVGASCSAMAFLLRVALDKSFANPAFGEDAKGVWIMAHQLGWWWNCFCLLMIALPFICAHGILDGGTYSAWSVASCTLSTFTSLTNIWSPPQGFTAGAVYCFRRKREMFSFINCLLLTNRESMENRAGIDSGEILWPFPMDLTNPSNIYLWMRCRDVVADFGQKYTLRAECNAALMFLYIAVCTVLIIFMKSVFRQMILFSEFCFVIIFHLALVTMMSLFAVALALEGEACNETGTRAKGVLSTSAIHLESKHVAYANQAYDRTTANAADAAHRAMMQLQEFLTAQTNLKPAELLYFVQLDKTLVATIAFVLLTQFTLIFDIVRFES